MGKDIGQIFYIVSQILAYILAAILIIQLLRLIFGGSWAVEEVILALVIFNLIMSFGIGGYLIHVNNKIAKVDSKFTGHFGWHKGKEEEISEKEEQLQICLK